MNTLVTLVALSTLNGVNSFVSNQHASVANTLQMSSEMEELPPVMMMENTPESTLPEMSQSMPFMKRPAALTGVLAGDVGFDPLGFAKSEEDLMNYREAEIKHSRLAMLAAAGWPLSELWDKKVASVLGMTPLLDTSDRVPSLLNGGLEKVSPFYWIACVGLTAAIDLYGTSRKGAVDYTPGDLGFDPLGMMPKDEDGKKNMQLAEIKNGRLAMIAIVAFAAQEAVSKVGVVNETPLFFRPLGETLHNFANSGYIS